MIRVEPIVVGIGGYDTSEAAPTYAGEAAVVWQARPHVAEVAGPGTGAHEGTGR